MSTAQLWLSSFVAEFQHLPLLTQTALAFISILGLLVHLFAFNEKTAHDGPTLFTTAGIFFTFVGIADGLYAFDVNNIEASVPGLLAGLKTAFFASVVGVFVALSLKIRLMLFGLRGVEQQRSEGATIDDLVDNIRGLHRAITGDEDGSLISEIRLQRHDSNDRLDTVRRSLNEFLEKAAESNSKALIEALREVIRDFNSKISEQFGDNFKQLNSAVGQLVEWQDTYRAQLTELIAAQANSAEDMRKASSSFEAITGRSVAFVETAHSLSGLIETLNEQRGHIENSIGALASVLENVSDALPQMERKVLQLTEQMTFGVDQHQKAITAALVNGSKSFETTSAEMKAAMITALQTHNQESNNHIKQLSERLTEQIAKLDVALERELSRSISSLGSQLTSLSKAFVDDYSPLVDRLRDLNRATRTAI